MPKSLQNFKKLVETKLKSAKADNENDDDGTTVPNVKVAVTKGKKGVGQRTSPIKANAGGPKPAKKVKKVAEEVVVYEDEEENIEGHNAKQTSDASKSTNQFTPINANDEEDEKHAILMGVTLEEFRELCRGVPTPEGVFSEDEEI